MNVRLALTTVPNEGAAESISKRLVSQGLAACVNILPGVRSIYHWEGKLCDERELLLIIKCSSEKIPALEETLKELHPYDTPEFVVIDPSFVSAKYAKWIQAESTISKT